MISPPMLATGNRRLLASRIAAIQNSTGMVACRSESRGASSTRQPNTSSSSGRAWNGTSQSRDQPA